MLGCITVADTVDLTLLKSKLAISNSDGNFPDGLLKGCDTPSGIFPKLPILPDIFLFPSVIA